MENKVLVVFDLDGTLNQTELHSVYSQSEAMKRFNLPALSRETLVSLIGAPSHEYTKVIAPGLSGDSLNDFLACCLELDRIYMKKYGKCYDGIKELLAKLHNDGMTVAVCSNSSTGYITSVLDAIGLTDMIDIIQPIIKPFGKSYSLKHLLGTVPHSAAIMVGDTSYDRDAAADNNIPFIACLYGYGKNELNNEKHKAHIPEEIYTVIVDKILKNAD